MTQSQNAPFCDEDSIKGLDCKGEDFCKCTHILKVDLGDVVEIILIDEGHPYDVSHPFHLHGHSFYVVAMERHAANPDHIGPAPDPEKKNFISREYVATLNQEGKIKKNLFNPPLKDNVAVPDAGFTVIRFLADNVGYWLFHCHMSWHNHLGMGLVIKVKHL